MNEQRRQEQSYREPRMCALSKIMHLTTEQLRFDRIRMMRFICERIPADGTTVILADAGGGEPAWADLYPSWDDEAGWDLRIETNEPEWVGLKEVYDHFRRQEVTWEEWGREAKVPPATDATSITVACDLPDLLTPDALMARWQIDVCQYQELLAKGLPSLQFADGTVRHPKTAVDDWWCRYFAVTDLLTEEEAIRHLRLDTIRITNPSETLRRYRDKGLLRATQVSKRLFYRRAELDQFLTILTTQNPR